MAYIVYFVILIIGIVCYCVETSLMLLARKKRIHIEFWAIAMFQKMHVAAFWALRIVIFLFFLHAVRTWDGVDVGSGFFGLYSAWTVAMVDILVRALRKEGAL